MLERGPSERFSKHLNCKFTDDDDNSICARSLCESLTSFPTSTSKEITPETIFISLYVTIPPFPSALSESPFLQFIFSLRPPITFKFISLGRYVWGKFLPIATLTVGTGPNQLPGPRQNLMESQSQSRNYQIGTQLKHFDAGVHGITLKDALPNARDFPPNHALGLGFS